jgi:hypothetical protein
VTGATTVNASEKAEPPGARRGLRVVNARELFQLGALYATPGALRELSRAGINPFHLLKRHQTGDWGVLDAADYQANERAVSDGSRIVSVYRDIDLGVMIITEAKDDCGIRRCTTVLLPSEY